MLGVDAAVPTPYQKSSATVWEAFMFKGLDLQRTATAHVAALLERGVRVLIYTGIDGAWFSFLLTNPNPDFHFPPRFCVQPHRWLEMDQCSRLDRRRCVCWS